MPTSKKQWQIFVALVVGAALLTFVSTHRPSQDDRAHLQKEGPLPEALSSATGSSPEPAGVIKETERPGIREHDDMFFLEFTYGQKTYSLARGQRLKGAVKRQRSLRGKAGIYFRSLSAGGIVLADGVLPDPLQLHYNFAETDAPSGGVIQLKETEFVVRLPALEGSESVELFTVTNEDASSSRFASPQNRIGIFSLAGANVR